MRGFARGAGGGFSRPAGGRGWRNRFFATGLPGWMRGQTTGVSMSGGAFLDDKEMLKRRAQMLQEELEAITKQLDDMER
jgi:hypothetical protein